MTDTTRVPYSEQDERDVLGCMMLTNDATIRALGMLQPADFYVDAHRAIFTAIRALHTTAKLPSVDPGAVASYLDQSGELAAIGGRWTVFQIQGEAPLSGGVAHYARKVAELAALRRGIEAGGSITDAAYDRDLDRLVAVADEARHAVVVNRADSNQLVYFDDASAAVDPPRPWVLSGLLRRRERCIVTGKEGHGKSTLLRQVAVCVASGLHPFTGLASGVDGPQRVLIVDLQEETDDLHATIRPLRATAGDAFQSSMLAAVSQSEGMNLLDAADKAWLESLLAQHRPALVCIGPVRKMYRVHEGWSKSSEEAVDEVTRVLDDLRVQYDCALLMEAHAGHDRNDSNWRIRGSSVWLDWPEVGIGMKPVRGQVGRRCDLTMWREPRHADRPWPDELIEGVKTWPWRLNDRDYDRLMARIAPDDEVF